MLHRNIGASIAWRATASANSFLRLLHY